MLGMSTHPVKHKHVQDLQCTVDWSFLRRVHLHPPHYPMKRASLNVSSSTASCLRVWLGGGEGDVRFQLVRPDSYKTLRHSLAVSKGYDV